MKKLLVVLTFFLVFSLTGCIVGTEQPTGLDYSDFADQTITSYDEAENQHSNKYIVYYYSANCGHCQDVKEEILGFFDIFDTLPFYIFDTSTATDVSGLEQLVGTPAVFVMSDDEVYQVYTGSDNIRFFMEEYRNIVLDYNSFETHHLLTYQAVLDIEEDTYMLYYYLENCPHCLLVKDDLLEWAFTKSVSDIYFMNGANVVEPDNIPTELIILNSGTPIILIMSNGEFTGEYYSGSSEILEYIIAIGEGKIAPLE